ncbi:hypothetical protein ACQZ6F_16645 [Rhizobium sp. A22-96]
MEVKGDMAFERLVEEIMDKCLGGIPTLSQVSAEAVRQGLRLVVSINVRVEMEQEHCANVDCAQLARFELDKYHETRAGALEFHI